jgi:hypothetical protein
LEEVWVSQCLLSFEFFERVSMHGYSQFFGANAMVFLQRTKEQ